MVKLDQEAQPPVLAQLEEHGTYVPRMFMFDKDGTLLADIKSGDARYPYFYNHDNLAPLKAAMRKALAR